MSSNLQGLPSKEPSHVLQEYEVRPDYLAHPRRIGVETTAGVVHAYVKSWYSGPALESVKIPSIGPNAKGPIVTHVNTDSLRSLAAEYGIETAGVSAQTIVEEMVAYVMFMDLKELVSTVEGNDHITFENRGQVAAIVNGLRKVGMVPQEPVEFKKWYVAFMRGFQEKNSIPLSDFLGQFTLSAWPRVTASTPPIVKQLLASKQKLEIESLEEVFRERCFEMPTFSSTPVSSFDFFRAVCRKNSHDMYRLLTTLRYDSSLKNNLLAQSVDTYRTQWTKELNTMRDEIDTTGVIPLHELIRNPENNKSNGIIICANQKQLMALVALTCKENMGLATEWYLAQRVNGFPLHINLRELLAAGKVSTWPEPNEKMPLGQVVIFLQQQLGKLHEVAGVSPRVLGPEEKKSFEALNKEISATFADLQESGEPVEHMNAWIRWQPLKGKEAPRDVELTELKALKKEIHIAYRLVKDRATAGGKRATGAQDIMLGAKAAAAKRMIQSACNRLQECKGVPELQAEFRSCLQEVLAKQSDVPGQASETVAKLLETVIDCDVDVPLDWCRDAIVEAWKDSPHASKFLQDLIQYIDDNEDQCCVECIQNVVDDLSTITERKVEEVFRSADPEKINQFLFQQILDISRSSHKETILFHLAEVGMKHGDVKTLASQLSYLFEYFPRQSYEFRETLRSLALLLTQDPSEAKNPAVVPFILDLAKEMRLDSIDKQRWSINGMRPALVFRASPHFSIAGEADAALRCSAMALDLGLTRLRESLGGTEDVHPVVVGTEWAFSAKDVKQVFSMLDELAKQSAAHPGVTYIPGSIAWVDPSSGLCCNMLPVFENGHLVFLYSKRHEKQDMDTIAGEIPRASLRWAAQAPGFREVHDRFVRNVYLMRSGQTMSLEICNDHASLAAKKDYEAMAPQGKGVDIQVVTAHGTRLGVPNLIARDGGAVGYLDHSSNATTKAAQMKRSVGRSSLIDSHEETNTDTGIVGSLQTYQTVCSEIAPLLRRSLPKEKTFTKPDELFREIAVDSGLVAADLKARFTRYLKKNKHEYIPQGGVKTDGLKNPQDLANLFEKMHKRYTFADEKEFAQFIQDIESNSPIGDQYQVFMHCLAEFLRKPIVLHNELSSLETEIFMPDRSNPIEFPGDAIEFGFVHSTKTFFPIQPGFTVLFMLEKEVGRVFQEWSAGKKIDMQTLRVFANRAKMYVGEYPDSEQAGKIQQLVALAETMDGVEILKDFSDATERYGATFHGLWVDPTTHRLTTGRVLLRQDLSHVNEALQEMATQLHPIMPRISEEKRKKIQAAFKNVQTFYAKDQAIHATTQKILSDSFSSPEKQPNG